MAENNLQGDVYYPTEQVINHANAKCDELYNFAQNDYEGFWAKEAEELHWFQKWDKVWRILINRSLNGLLKVRQIFVTTVSMFILIQQGVTSLH